MHPFKDRDKAFRTSVGMLPATVWLLAYTAVIVFTFTGCPSVSANTGPGADESRNRGTSSAGPNSEKNIERLFYVPFSPIEELKENKRRKSDDISNREELIILEGSKNGSNQPTSENPVLATNRREFSASAQTLPRTCNEHGCYQMINNGMSWEGAQEHCRSQGGFLANANQTKELYEVRTAVRTDIYSRLDLLDAIDAVSADIIWTGLTKHKNHYQWLTEYAVYSSQDSVRWDPAPPGLAPGPWLEGCPAFNVSSNTFHQISCSAPLHFVCFDGSQKEEDRVSYEAELRISYYYRTNNDESKYNVTSQKAWLSVDYDAFTSLHLTCNLHDKTSGESLVNKNAEVLWTKDDIFLQDTSPKVKVTDVKDALKLRLVPVNTHPQDKAITNQGSFQCEMWLPNTNQRLKYI